MIRCTAYFGFGAVYGSPYDLWRDMGTGESVVRPIGVSQTAWMHKRQDTSKLREFTKELAQNLKLPIEYGSAIEVDLDSPAFPKLMERIREAKDLVYPSGHLDLSLVEGAGESFEWFQLDPWRMGEVHHLSKEGCSADKARPGIHVAERYASEKFKATVEREGLTGLEFVWMKDTGKYRAPQWYHLQPTNPIGRGLDHEWFDPASVDEFSTERTTPKGRRGATNFTRSRMKSPAPFTDPEKNEFIAFFPVRDKYGQDSLKICTYSQYLRDYLPNTDFAYAWWGERGLGTICLNRKARDILVANGLVAAADLVPVKIWDELPAWAVRLDGQCAEFPKFWFTAEEWANLKTKAAEDWKFHELHPKPVRQATLKRALQQLRAEHKGSVKAKKRELELANQTLPAPIPLAWQQVLAIVDGFSFGPNDHFEVLPVSSLPGYHEETQEGALAGDERFPSSLLHITHGITGDFHSLDLSSLKADGECRVLMFSHETLQVEREWPSVAEFLTEILEESGQGAGESGSPE